MECGMKSCGLLTVVTGLFVAASVAAQVSDMTPPK
jgi:hypothetical protein